MWVRFGPLGWFKSLSKLFLLCNLYYPIPIVIDSFCFAASSLAVERIKNLHLSEKNKSKNASIPPFTNSTPKIRDDNEPNQLENNSGLDLKINLLNLVHEPNELSRVEQSLTELDSYPSLPKTQISEEGLKSYQYQDSIYIFSVPVVLHCLSQQPLMQRLPQLLHQRMMLQWDQPD